MTYAAAVIVCTVVAMVIHELGHLAAAKACRVSASELSLGLGPRVGGLRLGSIQFSLRALPLGSFVRLDVRELRSRPVRQQLLVHIAGIAVNSVAAIAAHGTMFGWV